MDQRLCCPVAQRAGDIDIAHTAIADDVNIAVAIEISQPEV